MKKLLVALLSLGLIVAFSMTAAAQSTVKFSGQWYAVGAYENNRTLNSSSNGAYDKHFTWTRTRVMTTFQIAEGLTFVTRFDALEKQWGNANRSSNNSEDKSNSGKVNSTSLTLQENIEMEWGYVDFKTALGRFEIGYQGADEWGTTFGDTPGSRPRLKYSTVFGPVTVLAIWEKVYSNDTSRLNATTPNVPNKMSDADNDNYILAGIYNWKGGNAGLLYKYMNNAKDRDDGVRRQIHVLAPYMKATFGPVYVEGEVIYLTGKSAKYEGSAVGNTTLMPTPAGPIPADIDKEGLGAYILARVNLGPAYVGGQMGYSSGDPNSTTKDKSGPASTVTWVPTLLFGNANLRTWQYLSTHNGGANGVTYSTDKQNLWLWNAFGGFSITPKINIEAAFSYMYADNKPTTYVSNNYGMEADIKASYKIYDNLTYMVGAGYLWTGDYFKGTKSSNQIGDDYLLLNQLTLNF